MRNIYILIILIIAAGIAVFVATQESAPIPASTLTEEVGEAVKPFTIIAMGDSLTAGYGLPLSESYPAQLEARLNEAGYAVRVINAGVSGETTRGNLERASFIRNQNPDIVLLGIGGNDALRFLPLSETEVNLRTTIETLMSGDNPPMLILLGMQAPLNAGPAYKQSFDALYTSLADEYEITLIPFITEDVFLDPLLKLEDGIHLNNAGYARVVDTYLIPALTSRIPKE